MKEIITALISARRNFKNVSFDRKGQRNKYATLKAILSAVDEALMDEGILFSQSEGMLEGKPVLETKLYHISGESLSSITQLLSDESSPITNDNQRYGAALSYARRYSAMTILGLYADEDDLDDYEPAPTQKTAHASEKQIKYLISLVESKGDKAQDLADRIKKKYNVESLHDLSARDASEIIEALSKK